MVQLAILEFRVVQQAILIITQPLAIKNAIYHAEFAVLLPSYLRYMAWHSVSNPQDFTFQA